MSKPISIVVVVVVVVVKKKVRFKKCLVQKYLGQTNFDSKKF